MTVQVTHHKRPATSRLPPRASRSSLSESAVLSSVAELLPLGLGSRAASIQQLIVRSSQQLQPPLQRRPPLRHARRLSQQALKEPVLAAGDALGQPVQQRALGLCHLQDIVSTSTETRKARVHRGR